MRSLDKKNVMLNWKEPQILRAGSKRRIPEDFLTIGNYDSVVAGKRKKNKYLNFNSSAAETFGASGKVSFSFEKDKRLIACFDPGRGVPFYKLSKNGKSKKLNNGDLIDEIYGFFGLQTQQKYMLKVYRWATINNMQLCVLTPYHFDSMLPVFEDELLGIE